MATNSNSNKQKNNKVIDITNDLLIGVVGSTTVDNNITENNDGNGSNQMLMSSSSSSDNNDSSRMSISNQGIPSKHCPNDSNKDLYGIENISSSKKTTRKHEQCPYRLLSILFSDEFAANFSTIMGNTLNCAQLDSGDAHSNQGFCIRVKTAFKEPHHPKYDKMQFPEDKYLVDAAMNPGEAIQPHDWRKLRSTWNNGCEQHA